MILVYFLHHLAQSEEQAKFPPACLRAEHDAYASETSSAVHPEEQAYQTKLEGLKREMHHQHPFLKPAKQNENDLPVEC